MNLDDLRALARADHIADTEPLTVTAYNLRRLIASHDALAAELGRLKAAIEPDAQAHEVGRALGALEAAAHLDKLARGYDRAAGREQEDCDRVPFRAGANALRSAAMHLRQEGIAARDRTRWADTDALGRTIKGWVEAHGSERVVYGARAASDRQLIAALFDYRSAQGDREGLDARLVDVLREVESRLWRANGGAFDADERARVLDELSLEASESRPELRAEEAARYKARWGREPCLSDCACPECVPRGAEAERLKALHKATLAELNALRASLRPLPEDCPLDLEAIRARASAPGLTEGPWAAYFDGDAGRPCVECSARADGAKFLVAEVCSESSADAELIAHARVDVPALLAQVERFLGLFARERAVRRSYEEAITWDTNCLTCAATLTACRAAEERAERAEAQDPTRHDHGRVPDDVARFLADAELELRVTAVTEWGVGAVGAEGVRVADNVTVVVRRRGAAHRDGFGSGIGAVRAASLAALRALSRRYYGAAAATRGHAEQKSAEVDRRLTLSIADDFARWAQETAAVHDAVDAAWPEVRA